MRECGLLGPIRRVARSRILSPRILKYCVAIVIGRCDFSLLSQRLSRQTQAQLGNFRCNFHFHFAAWNGFQDLPSLRRKPPDRLASRDRRAFRDRRVSLRFCRASRCCRDCLRFRRASRCCLGRLRFRRAFRCCCRANFRPLDCNMDSCMAKAFWCE